MSGKTNIEWTDVTWGPVTGCSKVSPGCANCYAETVTQRYAGRPGWPAEFLPWTPDNAERNVVLHPERLDAPLHWRKPRRVFVNSMSDLFHEQVPDTLLFEVFDVMARSPRHIFQILTKRPERMQRWVTRVGQTAPGDAKLPGGYGWSVEEPWPLPNVWLGVSVENQHWADERIPLLLQTPAAVHFVSVEPMLGPVDLGASVGRPHGAHYHDRNGPCTCNRDTRLDWVICGGESGTGHRPMDLAWARSLRDQCLAAGTAYFFKQASGSRPGQPSGESDLDAWKEFPR